MDNMTGAPFILGDGNQRTDNFQFPISSQWHDILYMAVNLSLGQSLDFHYFTQPLSSKGKLLLFIYNIFSI